MSAWQPGCWHRLFPPEVIERFYRDKERGQRRYDTFLCPGYREAPSEEAPAARPDALEEVVAVIVERLLPQVVPRLVEMLLPVLEKRLAITAAQIVLKALEGSSNGRPGPDRRQHQSAASA